MFRLLSLSAALSACAMFSGTAAADTFTFSNGNVDGRIGLASRPAGSGGLQEIETADDFILTAPTLITSATFTGSVPAGATPSFVGVELYRVFPLNSANPPNGLVPTRVNSPSDNAFESRDSTSGLTFTTSLVTMSFTALNSILNGINPIPGQTTGGEGAVTGQEVTFIVTFTTPFVLAPDHYFFKPEVGLSTGNFFWLSSVRPIVAPGTPFAPDLQAWIRNTNLDPNWLRAGTDIVGGATAPTFNAAFTLAGTTIPEPSTMGFIVTGFMVLGWRRRVLARSCRISGGHRCTRK